MKERMALFMQKPSLDFLPLDDDPAKLTATERNGILGTAAERYVQGRITEEQYKDIEQRYRIGPTKTIPTRRMRNEE
jgi:hypothetical protein